MKVVVFDKDGNRIDEGEWDGIVNIKSLVTVNGQCRIGDYVIPAESANEYEKDIRHFVEKRNYWQNMMEEYSHLASVLNKKQ